MPVTVLIGRDTHELSFHDEALTCVKTTRGVASKKSRAIRFKYRYILSVVKNADSPDPTIKVTYVRRPKPTQWRLKIVSMTIVPGNDVTVHGLVTDLNDRIKEYKHTKSILLIVNPVSGGSNGRKFCKHTVLPLLEKAHVQTTVLYTERAGHAIEYLQSCDLSAVDAVLAVGGDGTYAECVNGLLRRSQTEAGTNLQDRDSQHTATTIPIGIVPAGTGNGIAMECVGALDPASSILHAVLGFSRPSDVSSVHNLSGHMLRYSGLLSGSGMLTDAIYDSETRRWMGRSRYVWAMGKMFVQLKTIKEEVELFGYKVTSSSTRPEWIKRSGEYLTVFTFPTRLLDLETKKEDPAHGNMMVTLLSDTNRMNLLRFTKKVYAYKLHEYNPPFIENFYAQKLIVKNQFPGSEPERRHLMVNIDGEIQELDQPGYQLIRHKKMFNLLVDDSKIDK